MDLPKTQFLITDTGMRAFKRRRVEMLIDKDGKPIRTMTYQERRKFQKDWPEQIVRDRLKLRGVWTLVEIPIA